MTDIMIGTLGTLMLNLELSRQETFIGVEFCHWSRSDAIQASLTALRGIKLRQ